MIKQIKMIIAEGKEQGALENLEKQIAIKGSDNSSLEFPSSIVNIKKTNPNRIADIFFLFLK